MNRLLFFLILPIISTIHVVAQSAFPAGGYKNIDELRMRQPSFPFEFHPVARTKEEILFNGGNDYFMRCPGEKLDQKFVTTELYAVSTGNTLFINTLVHQMATGYADVLSEGHYLVFRSGFKDKKRRRTLGVAIAAGTVEFQIAIPPGTRTILANSSPPKRYLVVIDTQTGELSLCDRNFLIQALKPFPDIEYQYALEPEQNNEQTIINYMHMVNTTGR